MPRLAHRESRSAIGKLMADPDEAERIRAAAARAGMPLMRWVREAVLSMADLSEIREARRGVV
jgi:hypothetical protein